MHGEAYLYDAIRTPPGRGKKDGSLHPIPPVDLLATLFKALQARTELDTAQVDDVVLGCVTPIGEQGGNIARTAALFAGWDLDVPGVQINRFCASGLEAVNMAAMKVRSGWEQLVVAGGVESMSRVTMGSDGGAMFEDHARQQRHWLRAPGHRRRPDRHPRRFYPHRCGSLRRRVTAPGGAGPSAPYLPFHRAGGRGGWRNPPGTRRACPPQYHGGRIGHPQTGLCGHGCGPVRCNRTGQVPKCQGNRPCAHGGQLLWHRRWRGFGPGGFRRRRAHAWA